MIDFSTDIQIYDTVIEQFFYEYFEKRNIDISGDGYKDIPNALWSAAFLYVNKKVLKPNKFIISPTTTTQLIDDIETITDIYIDIVKSYNIIGFQFMYCDLLGISEDTYYSWVYGDNYIGDTVDGGRVTARLKDIAKRVQTLTKSGVQNRLSDDRTGIIALANNDTDVGLEYTKQTAINNAEISHHYALGDIQSILNLPKKD